MKILDEFKQFAMRGSVVDLAVGVIIGSAFQKLVSSLVTDIITPLLGVVTGRINLTDRLWTLPGMPGGTPVILHYGSFIQNIIDFIIMAFVIFIMVKGVNHLRREPKKPNEEPPAPTEEEKLLTEIRDLLKKN